MHRESEKQFGKAIADLLREEDEFLKSNGNINYAAFADRLDGYSYESLRKAVAGERHPTVGLMEECARILRVKPAYFAEYRIEMVRRSFDPAYVGRDVALANMSRWNALELDVEAA